MPEETAKQMVEEVIEPLFPALKSRFGLWDAHHRFMISTAVALIVCLVVPWSWQWPTRVVITWIAFSVTALCMTWYVLVSANPIEVARNARLQDSSRTAIFSFVVIAAIASMFAVGVELGTAKGLDRTHFIGHVFFALFSVLTSWFLTHTLFTLRYAHIYYDADDGTEAGEGLNFPDQCKPDYIDFAYFSFVVGMCFQVSDVAVASRRLRRLVLVHSVISFGFNAAILGLSINIVSGLFS